MRCINSGPLQSNHPVRSSRTYFLLLSNDLGLSTSSHLPSRIKLCVFQQLKSKQDLQTLFYSARAYLIRWNDRNLVKTASQNFPLTITDFIFIFTQVHTCKNVQIPTYIRIFVLKDLEMQTVTGTTYRGTYTLKSMTISNFVDSNNQWVSGSTYLPTFPTFRITCKYVPTSYDFSRNGVSTDKFEISQLSTYTYVSAQKGCSWPSLAKQ